MVEIKRELVVLLNQALELEQAARIQYLTHAELIKGLYSEKIIERLKEIASDEEKHEAKFRTLIANYLEGEPSMKIADTHKGQGIPQILEINLKDEKTAIDFYKKIYKKVTEHKDSMPYEYERLEHEIRHVILDEQEHATELSTLLAK
jgi:bacterioferritin (cytochrome b1)